MKPIFIWAHRGASALAPENTLAAFQEAESAGADGLELDIHLSREGVPVVIHDETLDRTTSGRGNVDRHSLPVLRRLDAGAWFSPRFSGERVPTLRETLDWAGERLRMNVEIKTAGAGRAVLEVLRDHPRSRVLVSSFDHRLLVELEKAFPGLPLGFLSESRFWRRGMKRAAAAGAESFHPRRDRVSRQMIAACHRHGLQVHSWTVDDPRQARTLIRMGIDGLFTNDPARLRAELGRPGPGGFF